MPLFDGRQALPTRDGQRLRGFEHVPTISAGRLQQRACAKPSVTDEHHIRSRHQGAYFIPFAAASVSGVSR